MRAPSFGARRGMLRATQVLSLATMGVMRPARSRSSDGQAYPPVVKDRSLSFPQDHGAHPAWRTEWWYVTGWLSPASAPLAPGQAAGRDWGFQVTFFRTRLLHDARNPSRFAPRQLLFAHAALALPERRSLLHAQRAAREGFGLAQAATDDTRVAMGDWRLERTRDDRYEARIDGGGFRLALSMQPPRPPVLQGDAGLSRKGPLPEQASWYYSRPHLSVTGTLHRPGIEASDPARRQGPARETLQSIAVRGTAWLDHEWSSQYLAHEAQGWDWIGLNLDDGQALMAFRIRSHSGATFWSAGKLQGPQGERELTPEFEPLRWWTSARTGARYPVVMRVRAAGRTLELEPLLDDQELDTRGSTGTIYWEGAMRVRESGRVVGHGYLELTGYAGALRV